MEEETQRTPFEHCFDPPCGSTRIQDSPYYRLIKHCSTSYKPTSRIRGLHDALTDAPERTDQEITRVIGNTIIPILSEAQQQTNESGWLDADFYQAITVIFLQNRLQHVCETPQAAHPSNPNDTELNLTLFTQLNHLANWQGYILENLVRRWWSRYQDTDKTSACMRYSARIMMQFPNIFLNFAEANTLPARNEFIEAIEQITAENERPNPQTERNTVRLYWGKSFLLREEKLSFALIGLIATVSLLASLWTFASNYLYLYDTKEKNIQTTFSSRSTCDKGIKR